MKKTVWLFVILAFGAALFANGGGEEASETKSDEPVVITILADNFEKSFAAGFQDDPVMKEIEARTGVRINITPGNALADATAKKTAMMASRDLPDMMYVQDPNIRKQLVSSRLALNLEPYKEQLYNVEQNRPGSFENLERLHSLDIDNNPVDGLYFIGLSGSGGNIFTPTCGFYTRWDLYKELGYPAINSYDDYITLAQDMLELEPVNRDGKKNYGISAWFAQAGGFGPWSITTAMQWDLGMTIQVENNREFDWQTGDMKPSLTDSESLLWFATEWWNKAYRAGIVDPDAFTQKWPDYLDKIDAENRTMIAWAEFARKGATATFAQNGETDKGYIALPSPRTDRTARVVSSYQPVGNRTYMISAESEQKDETVNLLNFLASWESTMLIFNGVQGVNWEIVDGKPQLKQETITGLQEDPDYSLKSGVYKYHNMSGMGTTDIWPEYNTPSKLLFMPEVLKNQMNEVEADACDYYGVDYPTQIVTQGKTETFASKSDRYLKFFALPTEGGEIGERNKEISAQLQNIFFTDMYEAILASSPEEFEKIKAKIMDKADKVGGTELFEYHKERYYQ